MAYVTRKKKKARAARMVKTLFWGVFLAGLVYAGTALLGSWSALTVREVVVKGLTRRPLPPGISDLKGVNLFKVDAGMIRKTLLDHQDIKEVRVRKAYPDRIMVTVLERKPLGMVKVGKEWMCVDGDSVVFPATGRDQVPVIRGEASLKAGLRLLEEIGENGAFTVTALSCTAPYEVVASITDKKGRDLECNFGKEAFGEKVKALAAFVIKDNSKIHDVDLRFIPYVVVRNGGGD